MKLTRTVLATALVGLAFGVAAPLHAQPITGAGASFPNPVYQKWGEAAGKAVGVQLNYQSVGSGAGQTQIKNRTVDFGASDAPLTDAALKEANLMQFPTVMGSVVAIVNVPGVEDGQMRLTGEMLSDIYLGKVTKWNDPRLVEMNRGVTLPNLAIAPVYRTDGSGTTFVWVSYLSAASSEFKDKVGVGTSARFPTGTGARGNEGVAGAVRNTRGAIGYVENAYATQNKLTSTQLRNKAGNFVKPTTEAFTAAAESADWSAPNFTVNLVDQQGARTWPIVSPTYILLPTNPQDPAKAAAVLKFFDWSLTNGDALARELDYIPLPDTAARAVRAAWQAQVKGPNGQPITMQ